MQYLAPNTGYYYAAPAKNASGVLATPDSPPTVRAWYKNAVDVAFVLTVNPTPVSLGRYAVTGTVPSNYQALDHVIIESTAVFNGISYSDDFDEVVVMVPVAGVPNRPISVVTRPITVTD